MCIRAGMRCSSLLFNDTLMSIRWNITGRDETFCLHLIPACLLLAACCLLLCLFPFILLGWLRQMQATGVCVLAIMPAGWWRSLVPAFTSSLFALVIYLSRVPA